MIRIYFLLVLAAAIPYITFITARFAVNSLKKIDTEFANFVEKFFKAGMKDTFGKN